MVLSSYFCFSGDGRALSYQAYGLVYSRHVTRLPQCMMGKGSRAPAVEAATSVSSLTCQELISIQAVRWILMELLS